MKAMKSTQDPQLAREARKSANRRAGQVRRLENLRPRCIEELRGEASDLVSRLSAFARRHERVDIYAVRTMVMYAERKILEVPTSHAAMVDHTRWPTKMVDDDFKWSDVQRSAPPRAEPPANVIDFTERAKRKGSP